ncbi:MAG: NAD(P)/FAD-dependent oxidoreductase [Hyphomicrobiaceae bacterium]|jgi:dihydrolipoamide dehydrogenase|nr:MAG: NAD(P)/FAD-dependent oxidoreductase [Hyphomicrobiaceae bacterium]
MSENFDAIVIGAGPAGEVASSRLLKQGLRTALIERELVGGECGYWACIPSKTLLRPTEALAEARRTPGLSQPETTWSEIVKYRDYMIRNLDDTGAVKGYEDSGVSVFKGEARIVAPGTVEVDGTRLSSERIVIATGSEATIPPIDGLQDAGFWTNREATTFSEVPESVVMLGGGPVGIELGQMLRRFGAEVSIVQSADRLIDREEPRVSELIEEALRADGVEVLLSQKAVAVKGDASHKTVELDSGVSVTAERLIVATGRRPRTSELGLEALGVQPGEHGEVPTDERCRVTDGVWAVGDVTGVSLFTHVGKYQARTACADIAGKSATADYRAIPRVVFTDPEIAAVGLTTEQAKGRGISLLEGRADLMNVARTETYAKGLGGEMGVLADRDRGILVGAWAVGPLAGEWIHQAVLAVKAEIPVEMLLDTVAQFPTFSEAYLGALDGLEPVG